MLLNLRHTTLAQAPGRVRVQQLQHKVARRLVHELREADAAGRDPLRQVAHVAHVERRAPREHLEHQHAQRPPVGLAPVALSAKRLGRDVLQRSAQRARLLAAAEPLRKAEVHELRMALRVDQHVLGLQVAVHDVLRVQVADGGRDLGRVEDRRLLGQPRGPRDPREELPAGHVVHGDVDRVVHVDVAVHFL